ncbi:MAG: DUF502 domain-containing protein, partial [Pseudomonadota bacterium]|nr:DUF502 domain-containing protein [Pseudomonadota bacterium]
MTSDSPAKGTTLTRLRNYFLTGFIITAPLFITIYLIWSFIQWVDSWVVPYIPKAYNPDTYLPYSVPGVGLLAAIIAITLIGFLTANFIGRTIVNYGEEFVGRMPFVRNIYNGLKQIFQTVFSSESATFQQVGLIEYPRPGLWALVFIATETRGEVDGRLKSMGKNTLSVFLPTTPNPTSGFLLFVPREDVILLDMGVEDAAKLVISAGLVSPKYAEKTKALADAAQGKAADERASEAIHAGS